MPIVPDVVGMNLRLAVGTIAHENLVQHQIQVPSSYPRGTVVAQFPAPGTELPVHGIVDISTSTGSPE